MDEPLISIPAAARAVGVNRSTLGRQVKAGLVRSHQGKVRLSEVKQDRANNLDPTIWAGRGKKTEPDARMVHAPKQRHATAMHAPSSDPTAEPDADSSNTPLGKAKTLKESYLAKIRELEFETRSGRLVDAEAVRKAVFNLARQDRDSWSNWPSRVAPLMAAELGVDVVKLGVILEKHVRDHLTERGQPALRLAGQ